ncbi:DinB family protein [Oceanobacillus kapialis]|uniref:DinB family protein n=1 Tax=Oceanobacillus kapialis TaxID=481353 RepID=A0ABW5Q2C0_9BACI
MINYQIIGDNNYSEKVGELVWMLQHSREITLKEISDLTQKELDYLTCDSANSIGALLAHINSIEYVHQVISFERRDLTKEEYEKWGNALVLGDRARNSIKFNSVQCYIEELSRVREKTLLYLKGVQDAWLFEENKWDNGVLYNNYYLWFHVMEDEINHRGQIRAIKRLLRNK